MSDKNRNMNDINDQKTAEQQAFSEEIRRRLAEPGSGKPTLDEFKVMVYKDREKRRKKRNALVACIVAAFIVGYLTYDDLVPEVGADKNPKETIQTEDGVIIEDGGWGSSTGEDDVWIVTEWEDMQEVKEAIPKIIVPSYIPKPYSFDKLTIESLTAKDLVCEFSFCNKEGGLLEISEVFMKGESALEISEVTKKLETKLGTLYIFDYEYKKATIELNDGPVVYIIGGITDNEIISIIESLNY